MNPDPLRYGASLPLDSVYYPLGFPLHIATNSEHVLHAAAESWGDYAPVFDTAPLRIRVAISPGPAASAPPVYTGQENLMLMASDPANVAACDSARGFAFCRLSAATAAERAFTAYYFLEAMAYHLLTQLYITPLHAACVSRDGRGVLLCGESGAGKTTLAYACVRRGWTYISDNESWLVRESSPPVVLGNPYRIRFRETAGGLFPELRTATPELHANGKMSINLKTATLAEMRVAARCQVHSLALLARGSVSAGFAPASAETALALLLSTVPMYEPRVACAHRESLARLAALPAVTLSYDSPGSGVAQLEALIRQV